MQKVSPLPPRLKLTTLLPRADFCHPQLTLLSSVKPGALPQLKRRQPLFQTLEAFIIDAKGCWNREVVNLATMTCADDGKHT